MAQREVSQAMYDELMAVIRLYDEAILLTTTLGVLRLIEHTLITEAHDEPT